VQHADHEGNTAAQKKPDHHLGTVEICEMATAPDEEKNLFSLRVNGGPDRDTMMPTKESCRVDLIFVVRHYLFCSCWPTQAHSATGR
jgi:hypothetical protein